MEIQIPPLWLCFPLLFFTLIFFKTVSKSKTQKSNTRNLPPGPWKLPLIGNIHNLVGAVPYRSLHQLAHKFGPTMGLKLGELSVVVVSSADAAKQIMKTHDINFASRPSTIVTEIITYDCTSITSAPYGDYWRQLRKICTLELLSAKRVQAFRSLRERVFFGLTRRIASTKEGSPINLTAELYASTYALISRATLGEQTKEHEALMPILEEVMECAAGFDVAEFFPSIKFLQGVSRLRKRVGGLHKEIDEILEDVIRQHRGVKVDEPGKHEDFLDVLLRVQEDELELPLTTDHIKSVLVVSFLIFFFRISPFMHHLASLAALFARFWKLHPRALVGRNLSSENSVFLDLTYSWFVSFSFLVHHILFLSFFCNNLSNTCTQLVSASLSIFSSTVCSILETPSEVTCGT